MVVLGDRSFYIPFCVLVRLFVCLCVYWLIDWFLFVCLFVYCGCMLIFFLWCDLSKTMILLWMLGWPNRKHQGFSISPTLQLALLAQNLPTHLALLCWFWSSLLHPHSCKARIWQTKYRTLSFYNTFGKNLQCWFHRIILLMGIVFSN